MRLSCGEPKQCNVLLSCCEGTLHSQRPAVTPTPNFCSLDRCLLQARWTETADNLARAYTNLTGDMLISAGIIAYAGAFTASYRTRIVQAFVDMCRCGEERLVHKPERRLLHCGCSP